MCAGYNTEPGWTQGPPILIASALKKEVAGLKAHLGTRSEGVSFLSTGLGAGRTRQTLYHHFQQHRPGLLIFTGTAGQLDPELPMGQVVCPVRWEMPSKSLAAAADPAMLERVRQAGFPLASLGLTVGFPVLAARRRLALFRRTQACICDMEAAAALAAASHFSIPAVAPKVVSDTGRLGISAFWSQFNANLRRLAAYLDRLLSI